jgi:hypothetical protein
MKEKKTKFSVGDLIVVRDEVGIVSEILRPGIKIKWMSDKCIAAWSFHSAIDYINSGFAKHYSVKSSS